MGGTDRNNKNKDRNRTIDVRKTIDVSKDIDRNRNKNIGIDRNISGNIGRNKNIDVSRDIKLTSICKTYEIDGQFVEVLQDVSLEIPKHQITVILGRSGCGKTTLLRIAAGLESFEEGTITGTEAVKKSYVFQEDRLFPWLNVRQNILFSTKGKEERDLEKLMDIVGLREFSHAYPSQLSGGMKQRVSIARAFACEPDFILMDEPFSALDFFTRNQMQKELLNIHEKTACSILFVTHHIDEALVLGDRIVILENGRIKSLYEVENEKDGRDLLHEKYLSLKKQIMQDLQVNR